MKFLNKEQIEEICYENHNIWEGYKTFKNQIKFKVSILDLYCVCHFMSGEVEVYIKYYLYNSNKVKLFKYVIE